MAWVKLDDGFFLHPKALRDQREPYPPARLSPFTERAYAEAEAGMRRHVAREAS